MREANETSPASVLMDHPGSWEKKGMVIKSVATRPGGEVIAVSGEIGSKFWSVEWTENMLDIQGGEHS